MGNLWLASLFEFLIQVGFSLSGDGGLNKVEVKQRFKHIKIPFSLARFDFYNRSSYFALDFVGCEVANVACCMQTFLDM